VTPARLGFFILWSFAARHRWLITDLFDPGLFDRVLHTQAMKGAAVIVLSVMNQKSRFVCPAILDSVDCSMGQRQPARHVPT
jgi:hypothetical protein